MNQKIIGLLLSVVWAKPFTIRAAGELAASLTICPAIEVEFGTETGKVYQLQGTSNLVDWSTIGDPVFGVGRTVTQVFSAGGGGAVAFQSCRLNVTEGPTNGFASWSLVGLTLGRDDHRDHARIQFLAETAAWRLALDPIHLPMCSTGWI